VYSIRAIQDFVGTMGSESGGTIDYRVRQLELRVLVVELKIAQIVLSMSGGNVKRVSSAQTGTGVKTISIGTTLLSSTYTVIGYVLYADGSFAQLIATNKTTSTFDVEISGDGTVECILAY
jgi:hypothetical protein